ncbi:asparagine synthase (glutamine-hydrolyzing) [Micromonospora sp. NPDC006766]|uniref:asparagine synthase (glutamine-hydrolyzing) n=1 Tax=Micromonospora sp. NPDC006766 TaxID=3154778 RepID=UPI0033D5E398
MCRIHGYFNTTASLAEVRDVAGRQRHGGPDATGLVRASGWGLGSNRLAIIDQDGGAQPYDLDGRITAVFNGEIYNHDELRRDLQGRGYRFPDRCDGSIIPALYDTYGEEFVDLLDGMYAIALVDRRDVPTLLLVTDHAGMKPLYHRQDPATGALHFASEIPALLGFRGAGTGLWEPGLDAYLASKTPFGERTMFDGIRVLPPAATLRCALGGRPVMVRRPPRPAPPYDDPQRAPDQIRQALHTEVGRLLVADVPVAVITSGGLDSSLVTALAAEHRWVHSFTIAYRGTWPFDERHYARLVARHAGTVHHEVELDPARIPDLLDDVIRHLGQPNADPITVSTYALFAAVHDTGFKAALTGDAADEGFGGYGRMRAALDDAAAGIDWRPGYVDALAVAPPHLRHALYTDEYRRYVRDIPPIPTEALGRLSDGDGTVLQRIVDFEFGHRLPAYHLRRVDHLSMASSVEVRLPFCQPSVVALARALPDPLRISAGRVKRALHAAAVGLLPAEVLDRPKQPFTLPITAMLAPGTPLWTYARDVLDPVRLHLGGQLDPRAVADLFARQAANPDDTTALTLWALMTYEVWRDRFHGATRPLDLAVPA